MKIICTPYMVIRWFVPRIGERQRLLTFHIWSYGSSCYGAVNDEDYVRWFINDTKLKVRTAHRYTRGTAAAAEGGARAPLTSRGSMLRTL